jgi:hypothetical protein
MLLFALIQLRHGPGNLAHQIGAAVCRFQIEFEGNPARQVERRTG